MMPDGGQVERAIRLSYAQMMLNAVFAASTGGMFLIGFALQLGADNVRLGLMITLALVHAVIAFGGIAGPFDPAYCLRDVGVSYFGLGLLNSVGVTASLLMGPVWGKLVDRFGCRPILITGLLILAPCSAVWLAIPPGHPQRAYWLLPWTNFLAGAGGAAVGVALSTLVYKLSHPTGRSIQLAAYNTFVGVLSAPMPLLGGWLVSTLTAAGYAIDLRLTFLAWTIFMFAAAAIALRLQEPGSVTVPAFVFSYFPARLAGFLGINLAPMNAPFTPTGRFQGKP